jgi:hypothetical protein
MLYNFLQDNLLASSTSAVTISFFEELWPEIIERRAFSMRSPTTNGPYILESMRKGDTAIQKLANMVLATEAAAKRKLSGDLRERIAKIAEPAAAPRDK